MSKPYDIVVFGATGFTGRLVVEVLLQRYPNGNGVRWAMGGRNAEKLAAVRDELGAPADTPLLVTDSADLPWCPSPILGRKTPACPSLHSADDKCLYESRPRRIHTAYVFADTYDSPSYASQVPQGPITPTAARAS